MANILNFTKKCIHDQSWSAIIFWQPFTSTDIYMYVVVNNNIGPFQHVMYTCSRNFTDNKHQS